MQTNNEGLLIEDLTPKNYFVPAGEETYYHARIEVKKFNANTGQRQSTPRIQKFGKKTFRSILTNLVKHGYTVDILHDPIKYEEEEKEKEKEKEKDIKAKASKAEKNYTQNTINSKG